MRGHIRGGALLAVLFLAACGGVEVELPRQPTELEPELGSERLGELGVLQDDYWTRSFGDYLTPEELHAYWVLPAADRFALAGERWLELCLREDLLAPHRWELSPEELERFRSAPDYESSRELLEAMLAEAEEDLPEGERSE